MPAEEHEGIEEGEMLKCRLDFSFLCSRQKLGLEETIMMRREGCKPTPPACDENT